MKTMLRASALGALCIFGLGLSGQGCAGDSRCSSPDDKGQYMGYWYACAPIVEDPNAIPPPEGEDAGPDVVEVVDSGPEPEVDAGVLFPAYEYHPAESAPPPAFFAPHPADPPGPKTPEAVVAAGVFTQSCIDGMYWNLPRVNRAIYEMYYVKKRDPAMRAFFERSGCFKNKANGCDAVTECLGYRNEVYEHNQPLDTFKWTRTCVDGVKRESGPLVDGAKTTGNTWFNCKALGLECYTDRQGEPCSTVRTPCDPAIDTQTCDGLRAYECDDDYNMGKFYNFEQPECSDYGMICRPDSPSGGYPDCVPIGPACEVVDDYMYDSRLFDYGKGAIGCTSPTHLRLCMGNYETTIDCGTLAEGFTCIDGPKPHCGFADECDPEGLTYCLGDSVVLCNGGRTEKVDCKSLGFTGCNKQWGVCSPGIYDYYQVP